jgi:DNA damage-binding protein 1
LEWNSAHSSFSLECTHPGHILALILASRGDLIIVADLMKSVSCLFYDPVNKELSLHSRDHDTHWMTGVESLSSEIFIGSDDFSNIFTLKKEPETRNLIIHSRFYLGDVINRFRSGIITD